MMRRQGRGVGLGLGAWRWAVASGTLDIIICREEDSIGRWGMGWEMCCVLGC